MTGSKLLSSKWDLKTQSPHGGQEWRDIPNFVEDFSVTTNPLGTPQKALEAAKEALATVVHYPPSDFDPALSSLAQFLVGPAPTSQNTPLSEASLELKKRLILGNGASELIDLCIRMAPGNTWRPGPADCQYREYERSSLNYNKETKPWNDKTAELLCIVNPCNPTGDFKVASEMQQFITEFCPEPNTSVIVDESMQPWHGPNWRNESLLSKREWIQKLAEEKGIKIFILHSWTKLWSCPGLRLGSVIAPTSNDATALRKVQVPWSVNTPAVAFLDAVVRDTEYLNKTWGITSEWRHSMIDQIRQLHPSWNFHGHSFLSFIWIDTHDENVAEYYVANCRAMGVPIRWGSDGYNKGTFVRLGVRHPESVDVLLQALKPIN